MKSLFALCILLAVFAGASAQNGNSGLDPSFARGGILIDTINFSFPTIGDLSIQPDGKIVAFSVGYYSSSVARYLPDGTPDSSFAINGSRIITPFNWR